MQPRRLVVPQDKPNRDAEFMDLLYRGPRLEGVKPETYTQKLPWKDEAPDVRFLGGLTGTDEPGGGYAGLIGALIGSVGPAAVKSLRALKGGVTIPPKITAYREGFHSDPKDAIDWTTGKYRPEISSELGRLVGEMIPDKGVKAGWQEFHKMNPEATGHVGTITLGPVRNVKGFSQNVDEFLGGWRGKHSSPSYQGGSREQTEWLGNITVNPRTLDTWLSKQGKARTTAHELQHQAQMMLEGRSQFGKNYDMLNQRLGYADNPYEWEANKVADEVVQRIYPKKK